MDIDKSDRAPPSKRKRTSERPSATPEPPQSIVHMSSTPLRNQHNTSDAPPTSTTQITSTNGIVSTLLPIEDRLKRVSFLFRSTEDGRPVKTLYTLKPTFAQLLSTITKVEGPLEAAKKWIVFPLLPGVPEEEIEGYKFPHGHDYVKDNERLYKPFIREIMENPAWLNESDDPTFELICSLQFMT